MTQLFLQSCFRMFLYVTKNNFLYCCSKWNFVPLGLTYYIRGFCGELVRPLAFHLWTSQPKVSGFLLELRFLPTGKVDRVG